MNFSPVLAPPQGLSLSALTPREVAGYDRGQDFMKMGSAYSLFHATRPATIGLALDSSPLALLAWIGEKFLAWSDENPSLETILESVSLYWFTESMGRGVFPYRGVCLLSPLPFSPVLHLANQSIPYLPYFPSPASHDTAISCQDRKSGT